MSRFAARAHVAGRGDAVVEGDWLVQGVASWPCTWRACLPDRDEAELAGATRCRENTGRPLGDEGFVERLGGVLDCDLLPKKRGPRPQTRPQELGMVSPELIIDSGSHEAAEFWWVAKQRFTRLDAAFLEEGRELSQDETSDAP